MSPRSALRDVPALVLFAALAPACAGRAGPPPIALGTPCAACGMDVQDLRFACERETGGRYRVYDSIECLLRDAGRPAGGTVYLSDYDQMSLHAADSLWIVKGSFPTPMDGGLAAFSSRATAQEVASGTRGCVGRWAEFAAVEPPESGAAP